MNIARTITITFPSDSAISDFELRMIVRNAISEYVHARSPTEEYVAKRYMGHDAYFTEQTLNRVKHNVQAAVRCIIGDPVDVPMDTKPYPNYCEETDLSLRTPQEVVVEEGPTAQEVYDLLSNSNTHWLDVTNKAMAAQVRQIEQLSNRLEDLEDESNIDAASLKRTIDPLAERITMLEARVKLIAERITVLEAWRKS
jgi:polyhydroxyalkanoate synthesis regulator phasin